MNQSVNWPIYQYIIQSIDHTATNDLLNISDCQYKTIPWLVLVVPQDVHDLQISAVINYHAIEFAMWANGKHEGRVSQSNILVKKRQMQRNLNLSFFFYFESYNVNPVLIKQNWLKNCLVLKRFWRSFQST